MISKKTIKEYIGYHLVSRISQGFAMIVNFL